MTLCVHVMIKPFEKWVVDFIRTIASTPLNKKYILVCINFVTKWVEARVVPLATEKYVIDFFI